MLVVRLDESVDTLQREGRGRNECVCSQRKMLIVLDGGPRRWTKMVDQNGGLRRWMEIVDQNGGPKSKMHKMAGRVR